METLTNLPAAWPRAVLFDLDGTLIDSAPMIAVALNQVIALRGGELVAVERVRGLVSRGASELVTTCFGTCATEVKADLEAFRAVYRALEPREEDLYPGARAMLARLEAEGRLLAVCTNKPQQLTEKLLSGLGLSAHFAAVIGGDACRQPKPHPGHIREILNCLSLTEADAVFVGDSEVDAAVSQAAAMPFILVTFGYAIGSIDEIEHQALLENFDDLPGVLEQLAAGVARGVGGGG